MEPLLTCPSPALAHLAWGQGRCEGHRAAASMMHGGDTLHVAQLRIEADSQPVAEELRREHDE